jgi:trans-o-hydroxybenzylidenepyruvate hydratase-aldolase
MPQASDLRGLYAIIPTPSRPDTGWDSVDTVDLDETARLVEALVTAGASGLIALGTTGECATLGSEEYASVVRCITETVAGRITTVIGASALGWADIRRRLEIVAASGATGTLLGLPMWQPTTTAMAVEMYAEVSRGFPDVDVMVYANERAFRFPFATTPEFWRGLVERAPTVRSAKFSRPKTLAELRTATDGRIHFLPNETRVLDFVDIAGDDVTACWATAAAMGPEPCLALIAAIQRHDLAAARMVSDDIAWANEPVHDLIQDPTVFASYNIQIEKARIAAAGYCVPGPVRPPYAHLPEAYAQRAWQCGERWRELRDRYPTAAEAAEPMKGARR